MITEKLLFVVHKGSVGSHLAGIIMAGHCLPIACSHSTWEGHGCPTSASGFYALWDSLTDVEEFFLEKIGFGDCIEPGMDRGLGDTDREPNGMYVYEVEYDETAVDDDDESWEWLQGGMLRRPLIAELEPLAYGKSPWDGVVL
jgi:hypothetical protein